MGSVNITLANGRLGSTLQTNDGVVGMILSGRPITGMYDAETPILIKSLDGLDTYGINESNNAFAYRQVRDFYDEAGTGATLYLMLSKQNTPIDQIATHTNSQGAKKLLNYAKGQIKILGIMMDDEAYTSATTTAITTHDGINGLVYDAADKMAILCDDFFKAQQPFRAVIGGTSYTGHADALLDMTHGTTNNRTAILIGDVGDFNAACLGLLLGSMATIPVMRKVSRVRTGALSNSDAYLGAQTLDSAIGDAATIASRGYITWCTYPNVAGYFFSGDDTCSTTTDDYHFLSRGRVIDKAQILAYTTFVQEVDDEVPVNEDGTLDAGFCKWLGQQIVNQINNTMTVNKEISSVECIIDPAQNILSSNVLNVILRIVPVGYATNIQIDLGFDNPAL